MVFHKSELICQSLNGDTAATLRKQLPFPISNLIISKYIPINCSKYILTNCHHIIYKKAEKRLKHWKKTLWLTSVGIRFDYNNRDPNNWLKHDGSLLFFCLQCGGVHGVSAHWFLETLDSVQLITLSSLGCGLRSHGPK